MERVERERWDSNPGTTHDAPRVCDSVTLLNCKRPSGSHDPTLSSVYISSVPGLFYRENGIFNFLSTYVPARVCHFFKRSIISQ